MTDLLSDLGDFPTPSTTPIMIACGPDALGVPTAAYGRPDAHIAAVSRLAKLDQNLSGKSPTEIRRALERAWALALRLRSDGALEAAARLEPWLSDLEEPAAADARRDLHLAQALAVRGGSDRALPGPGGTGAAGSAGRATRAPGRHPLPPRLLAPR